MTCGNQYTPQLHERGFRMTPQRMAILHVLHGEEVHLSPTEIFARAKEALPGLTEATVYRTLDFLCENSLIHSAPLRGGHLVYEIAQQDHHHHLICRKCGGEIQIDHASLEKVYEELESTSGFRFIDSHVTFFGLCPGCQEDGLGG